MGLAFKCENCGQRIVVRFLTTGEKAACRRCGSVVTVPSEAAHTDEQPEYLIPRPLAETPRSPSEVEILTRSGEVKAARLIANLLWIFALGWALITIFDLVTPSTSTFYGQFWTRSVPVSVWLDEADQLVSEDGDRKLAGFDSVMIESVDHVEPLAIAETLISLLALLTIAWLLRRLMKEVSAGNAFLPENTRRVRWIGMALIGWGLVIGLVEMAHGVAYLKTFDTSQYSLGVQYNIHPEAIVAGVIVLGVAQVFAIGARLQHEQNLTI